MKKRKSGRQAEVFSQNELNNEIFDLPESDDIDVEFSKDSADEPQKAKKRFTARRIFSLRNVLLLVCMVTFAVSAVMLFYRWFDYKRGEDLYSSLSSDVFKEVSNDPSAVSPAPSFSPIPSVNDYHAILKSGVSMGEVEPAKEINVQHARVKAKLEEIKRINDDVIGWIRIEGTQVNYPIVLGEDNDYYLTHAYNGEYLRSGTIFADYRNTDSIEENYNTVLYGHNMANGSMFAAVKKFLQEDYFNSNVIEIYTFDGMYIFEPFCVLNTTTAVYYNKTGFSSDAQYVDFLNEMQRLSIFKKDIEFSAEDRIVTLSTCNTRTVTGRYALLARLIKVE